MSNTLLLNKSLYDQKCILEAIDDFCRISNIRLESVEKYWKCIFVKCKLDVNRTILEFENYVIGLSNRKGLEK